MCGILLHLRDWRSNIWIQFNLNLNILLIERCRESSWEMTNPLWMSAMKADSLIDFLSPLTLPSSSTSSPHYLLVSEKTELWFNVRSHATDRDAVRHSAVRWVLTVCKDDICVPLKWKSLVHPVLFPSLFSFHSSPHPFPPTSWWWSLHFYVFKLWRCCIRYTVILNEQWEWVFFFFFYFCSFIFLWDSFESDSLWSLMKCTAHLCLWNQECILVCTYACVWICVSQSKLDIEINVRRE